MTDSQEIILTKTNRCGLITLNRPQALNSLTLNMIREAERHTLEWAKDPDIYGVVIEAVPGRAFSAGGDIRTLYNWMKDSPENAVQYYREEYQHNWTLERFMKPTASLINGFVMGGGVGFCIYGTHRVAGEGLKFAMPETGIGFFPDIGGSYFLSRFPGHLGMYLGLTGLSVGPADAYHLGVATHVIGSEHFESIKQTMIEADPIDPILERLHRDSDEGEVWMRRDMINEIFSAGSLEEIFEGLSRVSGPDEAWAGETLSELHKKSPLSLAVTFKLIREASAETTAYENLKAALEVEFRLGYRFLHDHDFAEGIRAAIIDKDNAPNWQYKDLASVPQERVDAYFENLGEEELNLVDT
ncbi:MAG: enoyl-CoA hydratase/isomerase family protein [Methyloligellaceae bacterium]